MGKTFTGQLPVWTSTLVKTLCRGCGSSRRKSRRVRLLERSTAAVTDRELTPTPLHERSPLRRHLPSYGPSPDEGPPRAVSSPASPRLPRGLEEIARCPAARSG